MNNYQTFGDIGNRVGIFAVAQLLKHAEPVQILSKWVKPEPMPKNKGQVIKWRRVKPVAVNATALTEGVTPAATQINYETLTTVLAQFGGYWAFTDVIADTSEDMVLRDATQVLGEMIGNIKEMIIWGVARGGTQVAYANGTARTDVNTPVDLALIEYATNLLKRNHAKKITKRIAATSNISTEPVNSSFVAVGSIDLEHDIRLIDGFVPVEHYASTSSLLDPEWEIGKVLETRFILSPQLTPFTDAGGTAGAMRSTTGTSADVYSIVVLAQDALGSVALKGLDSVNLVVRNPKMGTPGDPLGQRGDVSWKFWYQAVRLNESWMVRLEVAATALS